MKGVIAALLLFGAATSASAQVAAADSAELVGVTQRMLDAITSGDSTVWASRLAPGWFTSDEEGNHIGRAEFLAGLHPLPAGQTGKLSFNNPHFIGDGSVIVLAYDADEEHHYYGQVLVTRFHSTDTYEKLNGRWMQIASQQTALPTPIAGIGVAPSLLREYAGSYTLTAGIAITVTAKDSTLSYSINGRPPQRFYAVDDRIFIRHGVRGFWVFERNPAGAVDRLTDWRDNNAVTWTRTP